MYNMSHKKSILLIGGLGVIGQILVEGLSGTYDLIIADNRSTLQGHSGDCIQLDIMEYSQLVEKMPREISAIINLASMAEQSRIVGADVIGTMTDLYLRGSYNVFLAAVELGIPKVIFVSSNHVTDFYEKDGKSTLGREILVSDYPYSTSTYGVLKLAGEGLGYVFSINRNLSVICLRIGTVRLDEKRALQEHPRFRRTLLSKVDVVDLFRASIETDVSFGIYYGVSNNPEKPWSIDSTIEELGFRPRVCSSDILTEGG